MSASKNYNKQIYKKSERGMLEAYIKRFQNIKELREAFEKSPGADLVEEIQKKANAFHTKHTDEFQAIERKFILDQEERLTSDLKRMANILKEFEASFNNKHDKK